MYQQNKPAKSMIRPAYFVYILGGISKSLERKLWKSMFCYWVCLYYNGQIWKKFENFLSLLFHFHDNMVNLRPKG